MNAAAYAGRTVDLLAFYGYERDDPAAALEQTLAPEGTSGAVVAGLEKLVQRFLLELLTIAGSMPYLPRRGCTLVADALTGRWRTAADVSQSFYAALVDVRRNLLAEEDDADPPDERFGSAELLGVYLAGDAAGLRVAVTSAAGSTAVVLPPLPLTA